MKKVTTTLLPLEFLKKLERSKQLSWFYTTTWSGGDKYQVLDPDGQFVVDKKDWYCSCRRWKLSGIPCGHAVSMLYYNREKPEDYLHSCYEVRTFMDTYRHILNPTRDKDSWPKSDQCPIIPPEPVNNRRGRRTILRRREMDENRGFAKGKVSKKGVKNKCSMCGATGHNKRFHGQDNTNMSARTSLAQGFCGEALQKGTVSRRQLDAGQRTQLQQKDGKESNKTGLVHNKRKAWLPPGVGSSASVGDTYRKAP
ncbi:uncharacterized protein LOC120270769 [Dioscorea cayenensis subsp. rotundata]|uniref:Uncharacterized protein LOC120270769 n=1 Tax=Dioscorea cayennensis subsp. rotundata TaxID=55577 RepID=A0AB40C1Z6_DIOCR|nr:uncharacterized protein LOC120270769 [Dioscorea cayenensis subsp. rotundata]